ncbi:PAAR domain-containing protein [Ralstonia pseudosolanacearum]|uniref:PAAR domain-containing protein n=1 Tax=Ralstonia pseudosolanacearum TaxID=1310165 RepID=UPI003AB0B400
MSAGKPFIVVGDKTSHGGTVITGDATSTMLGKPMARSGDMTVCPKCKGTFPILKSSSIVVDAAGNTYARHMDKTECGANLLASQSVGTASDMVSGSDSAGHAADIAAQASSIAAPTTSGVCLECLMKAAASGSSTVMRG